MRPVFINLKSGVAYRSDLESNGVPVVSGVSPHRLSPLGAVRLAWILLRLKPDVLFINSNRQALWLGTIVGRLCRIPLILIHSHDHLDEHIRILKTAARWTDGIIAASHGHRTLLCRNQGFDPRRVKTVYPGIDLDRTRRTEPRTERAVPHSPVVGIVAALRPEKDHETFLQAAAVIKEEAPNVRFRIIGDGPRKLTLQNLAARLDIADATEFVGWQAVNAELLSKLDVLVLSSASETFPAVILESFSARVPVVATDVGSVAEMFSSEECGVLVPPRDPFALGDAVLRLLRDPDGTRAMSERACRAVEFYSADRFCADLIRTFGQLRDSKSSDSLNATEKLFES
jgi:glycosyltransferase involved in cell wall biosynthesis